MPLLLRFRDVEDLSDELVGSFPVSSVSQDRASPITTSWDVAFISPANRQGLKRLPG